MVCYFMDNYSSASVKHACENFNPSLLHGNRLTHNVIGLPASRADVILGSSCIILAALEILGAKSCMVSINGLRYRLLLHG